MIHGTSVVQEGLGEVAHFSQLSVRYEHSQSAIWYEMVPAPRPCFNPTLLSELRRFQNLVRSCKESSQGSQSIWSGAKYLVATSRVPGIFSLGGDLTLFRQAILDKDRDALLAYARLCIDVLHTNSIDLDTPVTTISLVQGRALGGGMEAALSSTVVIAEQSAQMGLPEIHFGLFPGMGAYQLLARRVGMSIAERIIKMGKTYSARELYDMGLVDEIAPDGCGREAVAAYIRKQNSTGAAYEAIHRVRRLAGPIHHEDLIQVTELWVDAAMRLTHNELAIMERFAKSQTRLGAKLSEKMGATALQGMNDAEVIGLPTG